ncbi:MAG: hypothetical protein SGBAC_010878 [Bacillariaceae sp.]
MAKDQHQSSAGSALMTGSTPSSSTSFSYRSHDSSIISAITLDDGLCPSERQQLNLFDPKLQSFKENKWAATPCVEELEQCLDALQVTCRNLNRFSNASEGTDTTLCSQPQRQPSMDFNMSSRSSLNYRSSMRSSMGDSDYRSSKQVGLSNFFLKEESFFVSIADFDDNGIEEEDTSESSDLLQGTFEPASDCSEELNDAEDFRKSAASKPEGTYRSFRDYQRSRGSMVGSSNFGSFGRVAPSPSLDLVDAFVDGVSKR